MMKSNFFKLEEGIGNRYLNENIYRSIVFSFLFLFFFFLLPFPPTFKFTFNRIHAPRADKIDGLIWSNSRTRATMCAPHLTPVQLIKPSRSTTLIIGGRGKKRGKREMKTKERRHCMISMWAKEWTRANRVPWRIDRMAL